MGWIWWRVRFSLGIGLQDAWQTVGQRMMVGLAIVGTTVILAVALATRQPVALLSILAYPAVLIATYVFYVGIGWDGTLPVHRPVLRRGIWHPEAPRAAVAAEQPGDRLCIAQCRLLTGVSHNASADLFVVRDGTPSA